MLKHAANLSDSHEYFLVWLGGSNARPWGPRSDAADLFPELRLSTDGLDLTSVDFSDGTGTETVTIEVPVQLSGDADFLKNGFPTVRENEWVGATLFLGTPGAPQTGRARIISNDAIDAGASGDMVVTWLDDTVAGSPPGYIVREDRKWGSYPNVRVLTPYQPTPDDTTDKLVSYPTAAAAWSTGGRALTLPAPYSGAGATSFEDMGLLLPLTFFEGIAGFGISETSDSLTGGGDPHAITGIAGNVWTFSGALADIDLLNGGKVVVDWEHDGVTYRSWGDIQDSTATTFTVTNWLGDDTTTNLTTGHHDRVKRYMAWVPHWKDSPYAHLPGEGFTYPNHDMQPAGSVRCTPRGLTTEIGENTFGAMLVTAAKLSAVIGKRVNVVNLAATDATLLPNGERNRYGIQGEFGWWDQQDHGTWAPGNSNSLFARLDKLIRTIVPNALAAEGNTKTPRFLGVGMIHGETDAIDVQGRRSYGRARGMLIRELRDLIDGLGYSAYQNGAKLPVVQPRVAHYPYGIDGAYARASGRGGGTETYNADTVGLVNSAIEESSVSDEFAATVRVDDLPRLPADPGIYSGVGEAELGSRIGDKLALLVEHGLSYGTTVLASTVTETIDICNLALGSIGDSGQITSLTDGSDQATQCLRFLPEARDELLQAVQWGFATRRQALVAVQRPEVRPTQRWDYCYVVPAEALFAFKVLGPASAPESSDFNYNQVATAAYETTFVANEGSAMEEPTAATTPDHRISPNGPTGAGGAILEAGALLPKVGGEVLRAQPYAIEESPFGGRYLFTNQPNATLQYTRRILDASVYPPLFVSALAANLAAKLASYTIKGDEGERVSARLLQKVAGYLRLAAANDAMQQRHPDEMRPFGFMPEHMRARTGLVTDTAHSDLGLRTTDYRSGFTID